MRTDPRKLEGATFDLLVIGGGIQGAAIARDAAARGARVLLVESRDFGGGTSSRSSRLVHGGLRYLQQGHLALVREALGERERLLRLAPHLVRPLPVVLPFYDDGSQGGWWRGTGRRWMTRLGVEAYSRLARRSTLPMPEGLDADEATARFPGLRRKGLKGAVAYWDARTVDMRLTLANVVDAVRRGAVACNHCSVIGAVGGAVLLRDGVSGAEVRVRPRITVNAAGPRADSVRRILGVDGEDLVRTTRGSHFVLAPRAGETSLAAFLPDGRIQFVVPHPDGVVTGTTDVDDPPTQADSSVMESQPSVPEADSAYLLDALGHLLDPAPTGQDIRFAYCGWRSLPNRRGSAGGVNREAFTVGEECSAGAVHTVVGGKLTTHRALGERVANAMLAALGSAPMGPSPTRRAALPGGGGPQDYGDPLWWRHGSESAQVREAANGRWSGHWKHDELVGPERPFLMSEVVHAVRHQGVVTFTDLVLHRLFHLQGPSLQGTWLRRAWEVFAEERQWTCASGSDTGQPGTDSSGAGGSPGGGLGADDYKTSVAVLRAEVARITGGLSVSVPE